MSAAALLRRIELAIQREQICLDLSAQLVGEARSTMLARVRLHAAERRQAAAEWERLFESRRAAVQALLARAEEAA